jgi:hypothetical protein
MPSKTYNTGINRRHFLAAAGTGSALNSSPLANAQSEPAVRMTSGIVDCQSHLFFPEVIELMRKRKTDPLVFDRDGPTFLKMGDWLRKVPPPYLSVASKIASMDTSGIGSILGCNLLRYWIPCIAYSLLLLIKRKSSRGMLGNYSG